MLDATFTSNQTSPAEQTLLGEQSLDTGLGHSHVAEHCQAKLSTK